MINEVTLLGHLGADPEIRHTQDGRAIANMRIATSESWKDKNTGERREKTEWHTVTVFNEGISKVCEQYLKKGSKVLVKGKLQTRKWQDRDGNDRYSTEVVLTNFDSKLVMLDGKPSNRPPGADSEDDYGTTRTKENQPMQRPQAGGQSSGEGRSSHGADEQNPPPRDDMDDEVPF